MPKETLSDRVASLEGELEGLKLGMTVLLYGIMDDADVRRRSMTMIQSFEKELQDDSHPSLPKVLRWIREAIEDVEKPRRFPGSH